MSALMKTLLFLLVVLLPFQSLESQTLEDLKRAEGEYVKCVEFLEKLEKRLDDDIKYWQHQRAGYRRWVWSDWSTLGPWVDGRIRDDFDRRPAGLRRR
jgi:hypothetical protein